MARRQHPSLVSAFIIFQLINCSCFLFSGDYASAIKTLVTAISLIKESKVSEDERCKILISSLRVTLDGVEAESYRRDRGKNVEFRFSCLL